MSPTLLIPPPTVKGMKISSETFSTTSYRVSRLPEVAVMSRKTSSSARSRSYLRAHSTGSPASRMLTKLTPFTTLPSSMSRQGMIRFFSIAMPSRGKDTTVTAGRIM